VESLTSPSSTITSRRAAPRASSASPKAVLVAIDDLGSYDGSRGGLALDVLDRRHAPALARPRQDRHGPHGVCARVRAGLVDFREVVSVDLDDVPAEGRDPARVGAQVPAVPGGAALAETVHVDDRGEVAEPLVPGVLERLPHRALRQLAVAAQHPDVVGKPIEAPAGRRHPGADGQPLAERAGRDVDPRQARRRMAFEPAAVGAKAE
jgi:hypothetical protein